MRSALRSPTSIRIARGACAAVLAANVAVLVVGLGGASASAPGARDVRAGDVTRAAADESVVITLADGSKIVVDPTSPEGRAAMKEAEARGEHVESVSSGDLPADAVDTRSGTPAAASGDGGSDAATQLLEDARRAVDDATEVVGEVVDDAGELVDRATDGTPGPVTTPDAPGGSGGGGGGGDGSPGELVNDLVDDVVELVEDTVDTVVDAVPNPPVTVTTPPVTVTTPPVVTTVPPVTVPPVTVTTPPATVPPVVGGLL